MRTPGRGAALAAAYLLLFSSLASALPPLEFHDEIVKEAVDLAAAQELMTRPSFGNVRRPRSVSRWSRSIKSSASGSKR